jgi:hypothetical protein
MSTICLFFQNSGMKTVNPAARGKLPMIEEIPGKNQKEAGGALLSKKRGCSEALGTGLDKDEWKGTAG